MANLKAWSHGVRKANLYSLIDLYSIHYFCKIDQSQPNVTYFTESHHIVGESKLSVRILLRISVQMNFAVFAAH